MRVKPVLLIGVVIGVYNFLYAPEEIAKNREGNQIQWIEGTRGWSENGTYLWTAVSPLPNYNVGIGTNAPQYKLDVVGHGRIQGDLYINSWPISVTSPPTVGYVLKWTGTAFTPQPEAGGLPPGTAGQTLRHDGTSWVANSLLFNNGTNIGIGTTSPSYRLDVVGNSRIQGDLYINSWPISVTSTPTVGYVLKWTGTAFIPQPDLIGGGIGGSGQPTQVAFWTSTSEIGGSNNLWWDNTNSRLGIGTNAPTHNLHVTGSARIDGDFYNQEVAASQTSVYLGNFQILKTVTITTHGPGSAVLLTATASGAAYCPGWYSISIHRDGTGTGNELCEISQGVDGGYDVELNLTWIDTPPEGTHTYYLIFGTNGSIYYWYSYSLQAVEIKK